MLYSNHYLLFSTIILISFGLLQLFLRRQVREFNRRDQKKIFHYLPIGVFITTLVFLSIGYVLTHYVENKERGALMDMIKGFAPTFSKELEEEGHHLLTTNTPVYDPTYQNLLYKTKLWASYNNKIQSIYTLRKSSEGYNYFVVDPETDYDHNGKITGKREKRIPIGVRYDTKIPELEAAFQGVTAIERVPTRDEFSYSLGAFTPIYYNGIVEAVLGIDFDGKLWEESVSHDQLLVKSFTLVAILFLYMGYWVIVYQRKTSVTHFHLAHYDHLTSLPNRLLFEKEFLSLLETGQQTNQPFTVLLLDVNKFKEINDTYGHLVGDELLIKVSERLVTCIRNKEQVFRISGDEFVILLPNKRKLESFLIVQKIKEVMSSPIILREHVIHMSASIGISGYPGDGQDMEALIKIADHNMYMNKAIMKEQQHLEEQQP